jgi:hypothetical protein
VTDVGNDLNERRCPLLTYSGRWTGKEERNMKRTVRLTLDEVRRLKSVHYHESLTEHLIERIKTFKDTLAEFYPKTLDQWIDGFRMDLHPELEISIWEKMAEKYTRLLQIHSPRNREERKEIFKTVLLESCESDPIVISTSQIGSA